MISTCKAAACSMVLSRVLSSADLLSVRLLSSACAVSLPNQELMLYEMNCAETPNRNNPGRTAIRVNIRARRRVRREPNMLWRLCRSSSQP